MIERIAANVLHDEGDARIAAASYLSWVAYPERDKSEKGTKFFEAIVAGSFKAVGKQAPQAFRMKRERVLPVINAGLHRIATRRLPAANIGVRIMRTRGLKPFTAAREILTLIESRLDEEPARVDDLTAENLYRDAWKETGPAIPMCMAMMRGASADWEVMDLLQNPDWVSEAILWSQKFAVSSAERLGLSVVFVPVRVNRPFFDSVSVPPS